MLAVLLVQYPFQFWKMGEDAEKVPPPPPAAELAAASPPNPSTVAAAVPTDATDAGGPNDGVSATIEEQVPVEAAQFPVGEGEAAPTDPQEEAVAASPKINDAEAPQEQPTVAPIHEPTRTNDQSVRTTEEDAMELEQQNGDRGGGKNTADSADDVVVDLLDSDDDDEVPA